MNAAVLQPAKRWLVQCKDSGMFLSDFSVHTITITNKTSHALPLEFGGADRLVTSLSNLYPALNWHAVAPVEG